MFYTKQQTNLFHMKYAYLLSCISLFSLATAFSQEEEDEYCVEPDKKVMKVLKEAEDPKNSKMDRTKYYTEAIDMAPNNAYTYYSFAEFNYEKANDVYTMYENGRANFQQLSNAYEGAAKAYKKVIQFCIASSMTCWTCRASWPGRPAPSFWAITAPRSSRSNARASATTPAPGGRPSSNGTATLPLPISTPPTGARRRSPPICGPRRDGRSSGVSPPKPTC